MASKEEKRRLIAGLLISGWLNKDQRQAAGWALLGVGVLSTFPIVRGLLAKPPVDFIGT
jgi:hypothetical protein